MRGIYPKDVNDDVFYVLGGVFADFIKSGKIIIGRDIRPSSMSLSESFIKGILDAGIEVVDIGIVTSPMLYFAVRHLEGSGGAMITASHNPLEFNGIKFTDKNAMPISGKEIGGLLEKFKESEHVFKKTDKKSMVDISEAYLDFITGGFGIKRKINVKVNNGSSAADLFLHRYFEKLGIQFDADAHIDFSVSFDTDGDRIVVFDENGRELRGDITAGILADSFLRKGDKMVCDMVSTGALRDCLKKRGIEVIKTKVGHYYIKKKMKEIDAVFGSEFSGHYYFKELNYVESAMFAFRKLLEALDKNPKSQISELAKLFEKYFNSGEMNIPISSKEEFEKNLEKVKEKYADGRQGFEDGILVEYPLASLRTSWWFNLRISNTESVMRLTIEAENEELLEEKKREIMSFLK